MNQQESKSGKQSQTPDVDHQDMLRKFSADPIHFIMENPRLTPLILLILAAAPIIVLVVVLAVFLWGQ